MSPESEESQTAGFEILEQLNVLGVFSVSQTKVTPIYGSDKTIISESDWKIIQTTYVPESLANTSTMTVKFLSTETGELVRARITSTRADRCIVTIIDDLGLIENAQDAIYQTVHDIRNPLAAIRAGIQLALSETNDPYLIQVLTIALRATIRLNDRADATLFGLHDKEIPLETINPIDLLEQALQISQSKLQSADATVVKKFTGKEIPKINSNIACLEFVLTNILENATKYKSQDRNLEIIIDCEVKNNMLIISIEDNGRGISKEDLPHIFSAHFRASVDDKEIQGFGLGLDSARTLIYKLKGEIGAKSQLGAGSTFYVALPLAQAEEKVDI